jgi:hypothetical protein
MRKYQFREQDNPIGVETSLGLRFVHVLVTQELVLHNPSELEKETSRKSKQTRNEIMSFCENKKRR